MAQYLLLCLNITIKNGSDYFFFFNGFESIKFLRFCDFLDNIHFSKRPFSNFFIKFERRQCYWFGMVVNYQLVHLENVFSPAFSRCLHFYLLRFLLFFLYMWRLKSFLSKLIFQERRTLRRIFQ